jgi:DNA-binding NarL/FixJ family response regulator
MTIIEKIQALKERFAGNRSDPQDVGIIDGWMQEAKRLMLLKSLKDHDGVKYVFNVFNSEIEKINEVLRSKYSKDLKDSERDRLLDKRELAQKYVSLFSGVEEELEQLEDIIDNEL